MASARAFCLVARTPGLPPPAKSPGIGYPYSECPDPGYGGLSAEEEMASCEWQFLYRVGFNPYRAGEWWMLYGE